MEAGSEQHSLAEQIEQLGNKIASDFLETVEMLSAVAAAREQYYDSSHSRFVAGNAARLARNLGMNAAEVEEIRIAGLLHDVGKISLPDRILAKRTTEMLPAEFDAYVRHPEAGMRLLECHAKFVSIAEIIFQHHERLDGSGFPRHLRESAIHPGARIIAVVNLYHNAMFRRAKHRDEIDTAAAQLTSTSGYLQSTQHRYGQLMNQINRKAGVLYDRKVVDSFTAMMEAERKSLGDQVVKRLASNQLRPGMKLAEDYYTSYGLLVAARGDSLTETSIDSLLRFAELGEIPVKVLVID